MKRLILASFLPFFVGCSTVTQQTEVEEGNDISWHEEKVLSLGYEEKNMDLSMEEMIGKQKTCKEYADEVIGEEDVYNSIMRWSHDHEYSPRFDRCFSMRTIADPDGTVIAIFDVLSAEVLFDYSEWCKDVYSRFENDMAIEEMREQCPEERDMYGIWSHLIQRQP